MILSLLVAMDEQGGIGIEGRLPWHLSADLKRFKELTMGHCLIMGRKTYESVGRPFPGRTMIVVTRNAGYAASLPEVILSAASLDQALKLAESQGEEEVFIIGGGEIFAQACPLANRIYLTRVHTRVQADTFFPTIEQDEWIEGEPEHFEADEKNQFPFTISVLERKQ